jgi:hypothetical protein
MLEEAGRLVASGDVAVVFDKGTADALLLFEEVREEHLPISEALPITRLKGSVTVLCETGLQSHSAPSLGPPSGSCMMGTVHST